MISFHYSKGLFMTELILVFKMYSKINFADENFLNFTRKYPPQLICSHLPKNPMNESSSFRTIVEKNKFS